MGRDTEHAPAAPDGYRALLDSLPALVTIRTRDGTYTGSFGDTQVFDFPSHKVLVGKDTREVLNDEAADAVLSAVETALDTGTPQYVELPFEFGGERFWRGGYVAPLEPPAGTVVAVTYDITIRKEREQLLRDVLVEFSTRMSRSGLERAFCELLVDRDRYEMAWLGEHRARDGIRVRSTANADAYLDALREACGGLSGTRDPGVRSIRSSRTESVVPVDPDDGERWARVAADHDIQAAIALPLELDGISHGVLAVYLSDAEYLVPWREELLDAYADAVSHALGGAMWRWALVADTAATLEFEITAGMALLDLCERVAPADPVSVESIVPRADATVYYLRVPGATPAAVAAAARAVPGLEPLHDAPSRGAASAVVVDSRTPESELVDLGVTFERFRLTPDRAAITATIPQADGVRAVVDRIREAYPGTRVTIRWGETEQRDDPAVGTNVAALLTDRQYEVLETAYRNGYFEDDRAHDLADLAGMLGISRWTFSEHLRIAQRKLLGELLD